MVSFSQTSIPTPFICGVPPPLGLNNSHVRANDIEANAFRRKKTSAKTDQTT